MSEIHRVLRAVSRGYRTRAAIAKAARLSRTKTLTYLTRLRHRNLVWSVPSGKRPQGRGARFKHYHIKGLRCLLMDIWG